jgi:hypothetical protein
MMKLHLAALYSRRAASTVIALFSIGLLLLLVVASAMYRGVFWEGLPALLIVAAILLVGGIAYQGCALSVFGAPLARPFSATNWMERCLWICGLLLAICGLVSGATDHWHGWVELGFLGLLLTCLAQLLLIRRLAHD